jgi:hydroxypyruvate reductase
VVTRALSDVVGGRPETIGGGPTVVDPTTYADAGAVLSRHGLWGEVPVSIGTHLRAGMAGQINETVKPGDPLAERAWWRTVGSVATAAEAAARAALALGYHSSILTTRLHGEAREAGRILATIGMEVAADHRPVAPPACLICGGETTVTLRRLGGEGGRSRELALAAALTLEDVAGVTLAAMGSDGIDGAPDAAGAIVDGTSVARARAAGRDAQTDLDHHASGPFFAALGDALVTGPTGTNVNDLVVMLVGEVGQRGEAGGETAAAAPTVPSEPPPEPSA